MAKLGHLPAFKQYQTTSTEINLEQHTKVYFDQFIRKKTVYCHINADTLTNPDPQEDVIDEANVYNVVYSGKNDHHIVSAASDGLVKVFSRNTGILKKTLKGHLMEINILCKSISTQRENQILQPTAKYLISGSENGHVRIWDTDEYKCLATLREFEAQEITSLIFWEGEEENRGFLMICSPTKGVCIYQEEDLIHNEGLSLENQKYHNLTEMLQFNNQKIDFYFAEISNDGYLAAYGSSGYIYIWPKINYMFPETGLIYTQAIKVFKGLPTITKRSMVYINWSPKSDYLINYNETTVNVSKFTPPREDMDSVIPFLEVDNSLNTTKESILSKKPHNPIFYQDM